MKSLSFKNIEIYYKTYGIPENPVLVLLHGYLESMEIWKDIASRLKDDFFLITPDIPGHGLSGVYGDTHDMDELADGIRALLDDLGIRQCHLVGHSMGGYITLSFRENFPQRLLSFTLFHSHCFADPEEKKLNREKEIELIRSGKKELIVNVNIPRLFADIHLGKHSAEIAQAKSIAIKTPDEGIIAILNGMKNRPDRCHLLSQGGIPGLLIAGIHDNLIAKSVVENMMTDSQNITLAELQKSGHMGFVEEKEASLKALRDFIKSIKNLN